MHFSTLLLAALVPFLTLASRKSPDSEFENVDCVEYHFKPGKIAQRCPKTTPECFRNRRRFLDFCCYGKAAGGCLSYLIFKEDVTEEGVETWAQSLRQAGNKDVIQTLNRYGALLELKLCINVRNPFTFPS